MRTFFFTAGLLISLSPLCMAGQIYKWVDAQGVTHFDAQPPPGQEPTLVVTPAPPVGKPDTPTRSNVIGDQRAIDTKVKKAGCRAASPAKSILRTGPNEPGSTAE